MRRAALLVCALAATARAQVSQDPTGGLDLPGAARAGNAGATSTTLNPASLVHLGGFQLEGAGVFTLGDDATSLGEAGAGVWVGTVVTPPILPRFGLGAAVEKRVAPSGLDPDPGKPLRLSFGLGVQATTGLAFGLGIHHFMDGSTVGIDGLTTVDLGLEARAGAHLAAAIVVRNVFAPTLSTGPGERRWDGEAVVRPGGDDAFELALGAIVDDRRGRFDPRLRVGVRLAHGLYLRGEVEARTRFDLVAAGATDTRRNYEGRAALGLDLSLGSVGASVYGVGTLGGGERGFGMAVAARYSDEPYPAVIAAPGRIVRAKLTGDVDTRHLVRILAGLRRVADDPSAVALLLQIDGLTCGWGTIQELRDAIGRVRARGKKVLAYLVAGTTRDYYLATAADRVYLDAAGGLRLIGLSSQITFYKELFDKIGVDAEFEKIAEYKSAPEQYTLSASSPAAREMRASLLDSLYGRLIADLAHDRGKTEAEVRRIMDNGPYTAGDASHAGIVDAVIEPDDLDALVVKELGRRYRVDDDLPRPREEAWARPQIAVVSLEGDIVDGKSMDVPLIGRRLSGGETLAAAITWARDNPRIEAIVVRVDSPGGSALASDVIAREVAATRGKKPIVVSVGDIAASGGYFVSAPGDEIFIEPGSITGSIGIFTGKFDVSGLAKRIGVTWETARRGARADMESYFRPYTAEERTLIRDKLRYFYGRFVSTVARGRNMSEDDVDAIGRGRVWTGAQALERKLADRVGGLYDAIREAKARAGLGDDDRVELVVLPFEPDTIVAKLLKLAGAEAATGADPLAVVRPLLRALPASLLVAPETPQARLPFELVFE
jgi:protease-4